jgi:cob(I)alamin adenosyltransferase
MRLYTGRGDDGTTDLLGARVGKDDPRVAALGALDEATSAIGLGRALAATEEVRAALIEAQRDLYRIMAELAFTEETRPASYGLAHERVEWLGETTDALAARIELPREFVLPGESLAGAALDVARAVARRAEREVVALAHAGHAFTPAILGYLNRLSSLLFIAARTEDAAAGSGPRLAKGAEGGRRKTGGDRQVPV